MDTADAGVVVPAADADASDAHDGNPHAPRRRYTAHVFTEESTIALYPRAPGDAR